MADLHAQAIQAMAGGRLHSVLGRLPEASRALATKYEVKACTRLDEFLADPELDVVTVATPSGAHLEPAMAAAEAGKHVVVERPLEVTLERADRLIDACKAAGVVLSGILNRRFCPAVDALKTAVVEGRFGTLTMAGAFVKACWPSVSQANPDTWRGTWDLAGGGAFMNYGIDTIDLLLHLAGDVRSVCATTACLTHADLEVEDSGAAILEFRSGTPGIIQCATSCWSSHGHPSEVQLCGESGSVFLAEDRFRIWDFQDHAPMDYDVRATMLAHEPAGRQPSGVLDPSGHQRNFEDVVRAVREGRDPVVDGSEARRVVALVCALYESARNGSRNVLL